MCKLALGGGISPSRTWKFQMMKISYRLLMIISAVSVVG